MSNFKNIIKAGKVKVKNLIACATCLVMCVSMSVPAAAWGDTTADSKAWESDEHSASWSSNYTSCGSASTQLNIQADDTKICVSVPTVICVKLNGDGTFIAPDPNYCAIINESIFAIHVSNEKTTNTSPFDFISQNVNDDSTAGAVIPKDKTDISDVQYTGTVEDAIFMAIKSSSSSSFEEAIDLGDGKSEDGQAISNTAWNIYKKPNSNSTTTNVSTDSEGNKTTTSSDTNGNRLDLTYVGKIFNVKDDTDLSIDQTFGSIQWTFAAGLIQSNQSDSK